MSLFSRFRRTVVPMSSSRKKTNTDDGHLYNYRKPTKSFNEKSVKTRNLPSYTDSHGDGTTNTGYQYHHHRQHRHQQQQQHQHQQPNQNLKEKVAIRSSSTNTSKSSADIRNKSAKSKTNNGALLDGGTLSRSNTFTLEDELKAENETYPRMKRKEKPEYNTTTANDEQKSK